MTYTELTSVINSAYATFTSNLIKRETIGAERLYSYRTVFFVKAIYKTLLNQDGDEDTDSLTKEDIQNCITLFNKYSGSKVPIEYT